MAFKDDIVAILDQDGNILFPEAKIIRGSIKEVSRPMEHPIESGALVTDHRIIMPIEINFAIFVERENVKDVYNQIQILFLNGTYVTVQTRTSTYRNQFFAAMPHEEAAEQSGAITFGLRIKEAQIVTSQSTTADVQPTDPANASTVDAGIKEPEEPSTPVVAADLSGIGA